jgi:hypothetical protein
MRLNGCDIGPVEVTRQLPPQRQEAKASIRM